MSAHQDDLLHRLVHVSAWLPQYTTRDLRGDVVAGLTVGVMLVPQAMAYALLAGLPPLYGLYASMVPLLVYPLFGTSRHLAVGIVALDMLIVGAAITRLAPATPAEAVSIALILTFMAGAMHLALGLLRLGFIVDFVSKPVIAGFTTAAPLIIAFSQLGNLLGMDVPRSQHVFELSWAAVTRLDTVNPWAAAIGLSGVAVLLVLRKARPSLPSALLVIGAATGAVWWFDLGAQGVALVGAVDGGLPGVHLPSLEPRRWRDLLSTGITLTLVQFVTVMALGKFVAETEDYDVQPNAELRSVGMANLLGGVFGSPPVSASFSRTAVNVRAGARTPLANAFAALLVLAGLLLGAEVLAIVPDAALAAIIMVAAIGMIDVHKTRQLFREHRVEGVVALFTLGTTLLVGIPEGVLSGVVISMLGMLYGASRPYMAELGWLPRMGVFRDLEHYPDAQPIDGVLVLRIDGSLTFANAEFIRRAMLERLDEPGPERDPVRAVVLDGRGVNHVDTTALDALRSLANTLEQRDVVLYMAHFKGRARETFARAAFDEHFDDHHFAPRTRVAVERAVPGALSDD